MILPDVNVLVYAHRLDTPDHCHYCQWLEAVFNSNLPFGMCELVLSGFLRIVTHSKIFKVPTPLDVALVFIEQIRTHPGCVIIRPGLHHFDIFTGLCRTTTAKGNLIPDAYLAALAIESGSEWITTDKGFAKFPALQWRHPLKTT